MKIKTQIYDLITTALGFVVGSGILLTVDYVKLFTGDKNEVGKVVAALVAALYGWLTNKTNEMKIQTIPAKDVEIIVVKEPPVDAKVAKEPTN